MPAILQAPGNTAQVTAWAGAVRKDIHVTEIVLLPKAIRIAGIARSYKFRQPEVIG